MTTAKSVRFAGTASLAAAFLAAGLSLPAMAQTQQDGAQPAASATAQNPTDNSTYATGEPLSTQSNEGFWGHLNPFARKKWVNRQVNPVKDRLNELDQLSAKNANDIRDVDARAQAGIHKAQTTADQANTQAQQASTEAGQAQQLAQQANTQTAQLNTAVSNLDQYSQVSDVEIRFRTGQTQLNARAKDALDKVAAQLDGQKGYIVEIQGYSHLRGQAGIHSSQALAQAVERYLVVEHGVPVYRIYHVAMGNAHSADTSRVRGTVVHVSLMQNSLAALNAPPAPNASVAGTNGGSPIGATQQPTGQPSPRNVASPPHP